MLLRMRREVGIEKFLIRFNRTLDRTGQFLVHRLEDCLEVKVLIVVADGTHDVLLALLVRVARRV
jgi:hypothetical protein